MNTETSALVLGGACQSLVELVLIEGEELLLDACRAAGMKGKLPNLAYLMRECRAGRLEAIKRCGVWRTSGPRVRAWLERQQQRRRPTPAAPTIATADPNAVLAKYGLARGAQ